MIKTGRSFCVVVVFLSNARWKLALSEKNPIEKPQRNVLPSAFTVEAHGKWLQLF